MELRITVEMAWTHIAKKWQQHCQTSLAMETARPQKKAETKEYLEKKSGVRNVYSRITA